MSRINREMLEIFIEESAARLSRISAELEQLETDQTLDMEVVHALFRETHSLKGAANLVGIKAVERIASKLEDILEQLRDETEQIDEELIAILNAGYHRIGDLLDNPQVLTLIDGVRETESIERLLTLRRR